MSEQPTGDHPRDLELIHPVYLDALWMESFFATLNNGRSYTGESMYRSVSKSDRKREGSAEVSVPIPVVKVGAKGTYGDGTQDESSSETKWTYEHTPASMFNLLRNQLQSSGRITTITTEDELKNINVGQLVEIRGEILGNPLAQVLKFWTNIMPLMEPPQPLSPNRGERRSVQGGGKSKPPEPVVPDSTTPDAIAFVKYLANEVAAAQVRDNVLKTDFGVDVLLTMSRKLLTESAEEYLLGGNFVALGKVTRVIGLGQSLDLTRRSTIAAMPDESAEAMAGISSAMVGLNLRGSKVDGPALQVLPLAVFV